MAQLQEENMRLKQLLAELSRLLAQLSEHFFQTLYLAFDLGKVCRKDGLQFGFFGPLRVSGVPSPVGFQLYISRNSPIKTVFNAIVSSP